METTVNEQAHLARLRQRLDKLRDYLNMHPLPMADAVASDWYTYLLAINAITGDTSNDMGFVSTVMAREYLSQTLPM